MRTFEDDELYFEHWPNSQTAHVDIRYPRSSHYQYVQVGLMDVRATDDVRIHYSFERNGWVIEQQSIFEWTLEDDACDPGWREVAFIESWGSEVEEGKVPAQENAACPQILAAENEGMP